MKKNIVIIFVFLITAVQAWAIEPVSKIITQKNAPLIITSYSAAYKERGGYTSEGINYAVRYKNVSNQLIVAVRIGFVSFDVWNEFLNRTGAVSIQNIVPGASKKGTWVARIYRDFTFLTGFAYVNKVRFSDGTIWAADIVTIAEEMQKIEGDFDVQKLKGKPEKE